MSVKIYSDFSLSSGGSNFKINYLKYKMRYGMEVHILLNNLAQLSHTHSNNSIAFGIRGTVKFYPEILEFKVLVGSNN